MSSDCRERERQGVKEAGEERQKEGRKSSE